MELEHNNITKEQVEVIKTECNLYVPTFFETLNSVKHIMKDREIYVDISMERDSLVEPMYYMTLSMKFNDKPKKCHEILARVTGTQLDQCKMKFYILINTLKVREYVVGRVDGVPYSPFPIATERTTIKDIVDRYDNLPC